MFSNILTPSPPFDFTIYHLSCQIFVGSIKHQQIAEDGAEISYRAHLTKAKRSHETKHNYASQTIRTSHQTPNWNVNQEGKSSKVDGKQK